MGLDVTHKGMEVVLGDKEAQKMLVIHKDIQGEPDENILINMLWGFQQGIYQGNHKFSEEFLTLARGILKKLTEGQEIEKWKP